MLVQLNLLNLPIDNYVFGSQMYKCTSHKLLQYNIMCSLDINPYSIVATNPCASNNGGCSHLCLLSTAPGGHTCACPDGRGYQLAANQRDCIGMWCVCVFWMCLCGHMKHLLILNIKTPEKWSPFFTLSSTQVPCQEVNWAHWGLINHWLCLVEVQMGLQVSIHCRMA